MARSQFTAERLVFAQECARSGLTDAEIVERLRESGAKGLVEGTLRVWWKKHGGRPARDGSATAPTTHTPPAKASASDFDEPNDAEPVDMGPDEMRVLLSGELRRHRSEAEQARAEGRAADARQSSKMVAVFIAQLRQIHAKQDDGAETIRIGVGDVEAAAERAIKGLQQVAERVAAERAAWPKCHECGQPCGEFSDGDKSPIRAMFERASR